jgi:hypothetical protein
LPPVREALLFREGTLASGTRYGTEIPYIIAPRKTEISDPYPLLRWNAVPDAQQYSVQVVDIRRPGSPLWGPITVRAPSRPGNTDVSTRYPEDAPALQPEITYIVQVTTDSGVPSPTEDVWFRLASAKKRKEVARRRDELKRKIPQDTAQQLGLAVYYLHQELRSDALALLDALVQRSASAPVHLIRAHVLLETQLLQAASQQYEQARRFAEQQHDRESQAEASVGLARTAHDDALMIRYYQEAISLYHALGDRERAEKISAGMPAVP